MLDFEIPQNFTLILCVFKKGRVYKQKKRFPFGNLSVGLPGLEPGKAGPESAVLPLHHSPRLICDAKVQLFFVIQIVLPFFLLKNEKKVLFSLFLAKKPLFLF